jgi:hypothetical protein
MMPKRPADAALRVFINCPFDEPYTDLLLAVVFTIRICGYRPVCALESVDSGDLRYDKLRRMVYECDLGIHDLSRTQADGITGLPRFNMPFELGLFLGARDFGGRTQRRKRTLVLAKDRQAWAPTISDLAGIDPQFHQDEPDRVISAVREFLKVTPDHALCPGQAAIKRRYSKFMQDLPDLAEAAELTTAEAKRYGNYLALLDAFLLALL